MSSQPEGKGGFVRAIGLFPATALNMSQMVGIGPFITIPLILAVLTGPLAIVGWVIGALIAICDGLVWAELGAAMPTAGGSYVYLREGFQYYAGRFMPFMFVWSTLLVTPLIMSTGMIGMTDYLGYFWQMSPWVTHAVAVGFTVLVAVTILILITAFASVYTGLLGASRLPFNAARDGMFFRPFGKLHQTLRFPHISLLVMGAVTAIATFFTLTTIISALIALTIWVQFIGQIAALTILRKKQPRLRRPYKQWLYPVPSVIALVGWIYIFQGSGWSAIRIMLAWTGLGIVAFLIWARIEHTWPFGPKLIREQFLEEQKAEPVRTEHRNAA